MRLLIRLSKRYFFITRYPRLKVGPVLNGVLRINTLTDDVLLSVQIHYSRTYSMLYLQQWQFYFIFSPVLSLGKLQWLHELRACWSNETTCVMGDTEKSDKRWAAVNGELALLWQLSFYNTSPVRTCLCQMWAAFFVLFFEWFVLIIISIIT